MNHTTAHPNVPSFRRLKGVARLRAISAALERCRAEDREGLGQMLVELAEAPGEPKGSGPVAMIQRGVTRLRAGGDPVAVADAALYQIAHAWGTWSREVRVAALAIGRGRWGKFGEVLAREGSATVRSGLALLVVDSMDGSLARAMNVLLADRDRGVAQAAERAWIEIATRMSGLPDARLVGVPRVNDAVAWTDAGVIEDARAMRAALGGALRAFPEHRGRGVLLAATLLLDPRTLDHAAGEAPRDPLAAIALSREESASGSVRGFLRTSTLAIVAERALEWLAFAPLARSASERIEKVSTPAEVASLARRWSLSMRPCRKALLGEISAAGLLKPGAFDAGEARAEALPEQVRARVPSVLATLRFGPSERTRSLEAMLLDASPLVRHALARHGTPRDVVDLAFDADGRVACSGAIRASLVGAGRTTESKEEETQRGHVWRSMARSPVAVVRAIARGEIARLPCWETGLLGARSELRRSLVSDREGTIRALNDRLRAAGSDELASLLSIVRIVGLSTELEGVLLELANRSAVDSPGRSRALANLVMTLGDAHGTASLDVLQNFKAHADARVRANAVQALGRRARLDAWNARRLLASMIELKGDPQHRVRANALKSILDGAASGGTPGLGATAFDKLGTSAAPEAIESLVSMLTDSRPAHRLAGVWLASRTLDQHGAGELASRTPEITARVQELARFDADAMVRHRAAATAERVARETRLVWKSPPAEASRRAWSWNAA